MRLSGSRIQAELYCLFKKIIDESISFESVRYTKIEFESPVKPSRKRADLVIFAELNGKENKPVLVIETKPLRSQRSEDFNPEQQIVLPKIWVITVKEALARGYFDERSYKYFQKALEQAQQYAKMLGAPFYATCYGCSLYVRSFKKDLGLYHRDLEFSEKFARNFLSELARLYRNHFLT